jgi:uncharacterized protein YjiS (DUF1127 family)
MSTLHMPHGSGQVFRPGGTAGEIASPLTLWVRRGLGQVAIWRDRARERRQLRDLSPAMLHDLGLTPAEIDAETAKPFWQP